MMIDTFITNAKKTHAQCHMVDAITEIPALVNALISVDITLVSAKTTLLTTLNWGTRPVSHNHLDANEAVTITQAHSAITETGTLVMCSSAVSPTSLNFLPQIQFVCLNTNTIVPTYEAAWQQIHAQGQLPRCVNLITGPSCTGDIEQDILWGAHGPKALHIILYTSEEIL